MERIQLRALRLCIAAVALSVAAATCTATAAGQSFIGSFNTVTDLSTTVPTNGDVNPYGVARIPTSHGNLIAGRYLISNFNNGKNLQGTGTTIVEIAPNGAFFQFAKIDASKITCPGGVGLTTALVALRSGFVIVGSLPTTDGTSATAKAGCLIVLNSHGQVVETIWGHHINGPWDMTAVDGGSLAALFVTNVLNGTVAANGKVIHHGTVVRLVMSFESGERPELFFSDVIADGFPERTDPAALVIGPTGVVFDNNSGILYVADSLDNRIAAIHNALFLETPSYAGSTISEGGTLNDPLGLALAPDHHLLAANGNDGRIVEVIPWTKTQIASKLVDNTGGPPPGAGALFGLIASSNGVYFVDDASNTFNLLH